jgi:hypothetical protein
MPSDKVNAETPSLNSEESVYVVYRSHGEYEGDSVFAICSSLEKAEKARVTLAAMRHILIREIGILTVSCDFVYLDSIFVFQKERVPIE